MTNQTITAQNIYDWRESTSAVSGQDLHLFFNAVVGDLSPSGKAVLYRSQIEEIALGNFERETGLAHIVAACDTMEAETAKLIADHFFPLESIPATGDGKEPPTYEIE